MKAKKVEKQADIVVEKYNGAVKIAFIEDGHKYYVSNKRDDGTYTEYQRNRRNVSRVAGIIDKSAAIKYWLDDLYYHKLKEMKDEQGQITYGDIEDLRGFHEEELDYHSNVGDEAHEWIEDYIEGNDPAMPEHGAAINCINGFREWEENHDVVWLATEVLVYAFHEDYLGKADAIALVDGKLALIDFKTSKGIYNSVMMQTAAYAQALIQEELKTGGNGVLGNLDIDKDFPNEPIIEKRWVIRLEKRTEEEFEEEMERKGKDDTYRPFEAVCLDQDNIAEGGKRQAQKDYRAFEAGMKLLEWDLQSKSTLRDLRDNKTKVL